MREIRLYGSEGGGAGCSPYPYQTSHQDHWIPAFAGMTSNSGYHRFCKTQAMTATL